jgi:G3E family GTPase
MQLIPATATHIISGFLGAGKTTVLQHLLAQKPKDQRWAVLMNEFGEIGLDQHWLGPQQEIAIKEVLGGCLCCSSQLPMQVALARLLSEFKPQRLFIETTGLGHPKTLVEQLSAAHWQSSLQLKQLLCLVDGSRLHQRLWEQHAVFLQQLEVADTVLISHQQQMQPPDHYELKQLQAAHSFPAKQWLLSDFGHIDLASLDQAHVHVVLKKQRLWSQPLPMAQHRDATEPKTLPYCYQQQRDGYHVAGWHLPQAWQFNADAVLGMLQRLEAVERIKAKLNSDQGWIDINAIPRQFSVDFAASAGPRLARY